MPRFSEADKEELKHMIEPLNDWMNKHCTPHDTIIIQQGHYEVLEGVCAGTFPLVD